MLVDNFDLIANYIEDHKGKLFYDCSIIRRGKDHPNLPSANHTIKTYYINSPESLLKRKEEMVALCNQFGARIYINLAPKSYEKLAKLTAFRLNERIYNGDFKKIYKCFNSCAGELKGENAAWVVDVDDLELKPQLVNWLEQWFEVYNTDYFENKMIRTIIPTLSGCHIITDAFNLQAFRKYFPTVDVHKNNPTLLYTNSDLFSK